MLELLHIENIAIIEFADIMFQKGFNVLSGETGAGKSIVIDSLSAVLGERTSRDLIRSGSNKAYVSAIFSNIDDSQFRNIDVHPDNLGNLLLEREIYSDGRNICKANGRILTVSQLRSIGNQLLNIHGQHDGQQLLDETQHCIYLDNFAHLQDKIDNFQDIFKEYKEIENKINSLKMDEGEKARKLDILHFQIKELEAANLHVGEEEMLLSKKRMMKDSEKILKSISECDYLLSGDDDRDGVLSSLKQASKLVDSLSDFDDEMGELIQRLNSSYLELYDIAESINSIKNHFDYSQNDLDDVESRLDLIYRLKKKYGPTIEEILQFLDSCKKEAETIELSDEKILFLEKDLNSLKIKTVQFAEEISNLRREAAFQLKSQIVKELSDLNMPKVQFQVQQSHCDLCENGIDTISFLMSANPGESLKPISKIASGGELARIMLALKNVLSEQDHVQTLVFDEIDTGVSGIAAQKIAEKLSILSKKRQILCVTHLPQIAAMADDQFMVSKEVKDNRTFTNVKLLSYDERINEIARLTGGSHISDIILKGAEELLSAAMSFKNQSC